ncbi:hypothetical protein AB0G76_04925 [Streptomyces asoensis]|uniref:hypothetical protein n=1 Tax=Streptomyces asoensis TaxID=249586 RepID=UPI0033CE9A17
MCTLLPTPAAASGALASLALLLALALAPPAAAAGTHDITADVLAGRDVTLLGDSVVTVPPGTTAVIRRAGAPPFLDHTGDAPTTGAFDGLREGAEVETAGTAHRTGHRITYRGGDGNDVVLTPEAAHPSATPQRAGDASDTPPPRTRGAFGWWPYVLAAGLLGTLLVPSSLRVRGPAGRGSAGRGTADRRAGGRGASGRRSGGRRGGRRHSAAG